MINKNEIQDIFDKLLIVEKLYDQIRLIDPILKKVVIYGDVEEKEFHMKCFNIWGKENVCENCVSMRAYNENQTFVKLDYTPNDIYMVTAIPVQLNDRSVVIELFKNVTNSMVIESLEGDNRSTVYSMVDSINLLASKDSLTEIYNRRYIYEKLPVDVMNAALSNHSIALIMTDIDYFKKVNDTYGHLAGDYVLKTYATILSKGLKRESDWVARYGGEEFLICAPGAGKDTSVEIAERFRKTLEETEMVFGEHRFKITASFGICHMMPTAGINIDEIIEYADKKLYEAKHNGRNRVEA